MMFLIYLHTCYVERNLYVEILHMFSIVLLPFNKVFVRKCIL